MLTLGIETSCDDTAFALLEGHNVITSVRMSQKEHAPFGGVVPELAARSHQGHWKTLLNKLFVQSDLSWKEVDLIAVTQGPGLQPSLLTGTTIGSYASLLYQKPLIGVHHILGHMLSVHLERNPQEVMLPSLVLTVSGGHTEMYLRDNQTFTLLGKTLDDAAGEAFDKVAKMLHLGYPGGPIVSRYASGGDRNAFELPRIYIHPQSLDFSFSGLKAAVRRLIEHQYPHWLENSSTSTSHTPEESQFIADLCASFEHTVFLTFRKKIERALTRYPQICQVHFVGGVSANTYLITQLQNWLKSSFQIELLTPTKIEYCTDNAAMIALAGNYLYAQSPSNARIRHLDPQSRMDLKTFIS